MGAFHRLNCADFMQRFSGYGDYAGRYWFVGMEEGGGASAGDIGRRLEAWDARGRRELEDVAGYHRSFGVDRLFCEGRV